MRKEYEILCLKSSEEGRPSYEHTLCPGGPWGPATPGGPVIPWNQRSFDVELLETNINSFLLLLLFLNGPLLRVPHVVQEAPAETEIFCEEVETSAVVKLPATVTVIPLVPLCLLPETPSHRADPGLLWLLVDPEGTATQVSSRCSSRSHPEELSQWGRGVPSLVFKSRPSV